MRRFQQDIEFDENLQPIIGKQAEILSRLLPYLSVIAVYMLSLSLSFCLVWLGHSPILSLLGTVVGFLVAIIAWLVAFLLFGLFGGNFAFAKSVFFLVQQMDFRISILILFASIYFARVLAGIISRAGFSYSNRLKLLWVFLSVIFIGSVLCCGYLNSREAAASYYFVYLVSGMGYFFLCSSGINKKEDEHEKAVNRLLKQEFPKEDYSWEGLRRIFRDLT